MTFEKKISHHVTTGYRQVWAALSQTLMPAIPSLLYF